MSSFGINIEHWTAWAPGLETDVQWQEWAEGKRNLGESGKPDLSAFPPMLRRRLSQSGKSAVHTVLCLPEDVQNMPAVFCSQYGEVSRSTKLLSAIARNEPLSPTDFSLSVHNAVAGVYSIGCNQTGNITALSAGPGGITLAILEAKSILETSDSRHVLCVIYDTPLPQPYPTAMNACSFAYAIALVLSSDDSASEQFLITLQQNKRDDERKDDQGQFTPEVFLRFLLDKKMKSINLLSGNTVWNYTRPALD
jgi:hypothetical protein